MKIKIAIVTLQVSALIGFGFYHYQLDQQVDQLEAAFLDYEQEQKRNPAEAWSRSPNLLQIQDYVKTTGTTHEQENAARLRENPCFEKLVARFYAKVRMTDIESSLPENLLTARAAQTQSLSATSVPAAGWLWKLALQQTQGDHNLALYVIGACSLPNSQLSWSEDHGLLAAERAAVIAKVREVAQRITPTSNQAEELEFIVKSYLEKPVCPTSTSKMYWPGSLGAEYDVANSALIKDKERDAHFENVVHSAFSSCLLYQKGMPSPLIEELQERLRSLQRSERMCKLLQTALVQADTLKFDEFDWTSGAAQSILKTLGDNPKICEEDADFSPELKPLTDRICPVMRNQAPTVKGPAELLPVMHQAFVDLDTAMFLRTHPQWRLTAGCDKPEGRRLLPTLLQSAPSLRCPARWSPARCARVMRNLEDWVRDDLYQAEQMRAGLNFSRHHCASLGLESPLRNACTLAGDQPPAPDAPPAQ